MSHKRLRGHFLAASSAIVIVSFAAIPFVNYGYDEGSDFNDNPQDHLYQTSVIKCNEIELYALSYVVDHSFEEYLEEHDRTENSLACKYDSDDISVEATFIEDDSEEEGIDSDECAGTTLTSYDTCMEESDSHVQFSSTIENIQFHTRFEFSESLQYDEMYIELVKTHNHIGDRIESINNQ